MNEQALAEVRQWYAAVGSAHRSFLRWHCGVGIASHNGVSIEALNPPGLAWAESAQDIVYVAGGPHTVDGSPMTADQVDDVARLLVRLESDGRDAWDGQSTLAVVIR